MIAPRVQKVNSRKCSMAIIHCIHSSVAVVQPVPRRVLEQTLATRSCVPWHVAFRFAIWWATWFLVYVCLWAAQGMSCSGVHLHAQRSRHCSSPCSFRVFFVICFIVFDSLASIHCSLSFVCLQNSLVRSEPRFHYFILTRYCRACW